MRRTAPILTVLALLCAGGVAAQDGKQDPASAKELEDGLYARIKTNMGVMVIRLHYRKAPSAVYSFVGLAEGTIEWEEPKTGKPQKNRPFYDGLTFHRVIKKFVVQGGCPLNDGSGDPGYTFGDEFHPDLSHDSAGVVGLANRGPNTASNGSQFYLTLNAVPHLDPRQTIFGKLVRGFDVLKAMGEVDIDDANRPKTPIVIEKVSIERKGTEARNWDPFKAARKKVPAAEGEVDPATIWKKGQETVRRLNAQLVLIQYKTAISAGLICPYDKDEAKIVADAIVDLARRKGADFGALERSYSDQHLNGQSLELSRSNPRLARLFKEGFTLKVGQVSDPIDTPIGWAVLRRVPTVMARHIVVSWKGKRYPKVTRTREQALELAKVIQANIRKGEDFLSMLEQYHDPLKAPIPPKGRGLGRTERFGPTDYAPVGPVANKLEPGAVADPVEGPDGFYIIQRVKPITVRHILISWKNNKRVPGVRRSKEEAKAMAERIARKIKDGADFEDYLEESDDKVIKGGRFEDIAPEDMVKPFSEAAFALDIDAVTEVVETAFGFHIIQRLK